MVKYYILTFFGFLTRVCSAQADQPSLAPLRIHEAVTVDGELDEPIWQEATGWSGFIQCLPSIGANPTERTILKVMYDDDYIYVGVIAYDDNPGKIVATGLERDVYYSSDDNICLALDTYHDQRQGILFSTNALSARFDEEVLDNGNAFNAAFNTFWDVRSTIQDNGYVVEFRIPFSSLRFHASDSVTMGIKAIRYIKHKNELDAFPVSDATVANAPWRINNAAPIVFKGLRTRKPFYIAPYVKATYHDFKSWNNETSRLAANREFMPRNYYHHNTALDKVISNMGFEVKYGLSKNLTLDVTVNTDFAQAETDNRVLNFTRFAVNLPEKRNFFLESKDYLGFSTGSGMLLFNSRTIGIEKAHIVPIIGGIRLSGKIGGFQIGLLDLQTASIDPINVDPQHFTVIRARQEAWGNGSYIGGIITNRISTQGQVFNNQTVGLDALRRFKDNKWTAAINLGSTNDHRQGLSLKSSMANIVVNRVSTVGYNLTSTIEYTGQAFKPAVGFRPDSSYVSATITNGYVWKWKHSEKRNLYWITQFTDYKYRIINNTHESFYAEAELGSSYNSGASIVVAPFVGREFLPYDWNFVNDIVLPSGYYHYPGVRIRYDSKQTRPLYYAITTRFMGFYSGKRFNAIATGYYAINKNFRLNYGWEFNAFDFPVARSASSSPSFQSNLVSFGVAFTQSIFFSAKALIQYDDVSKTIGGNFRLRINPKEGTDLFIVYNPRLHTAFPNYEKPLIDQQTLIVKFTKTFSL